MLEKLGLPPKPSLRGNIWVVDASHCQGCSSQFTFINRKHHCRRCGGIFCNSCTQQRMVLRGQGDSPVRICEPCKKLEEAARFEMRYGQKSRAGRVVLAGGLKLGPKNEDEILNQILGSEGKESTSGSNIQDASTQEEEGGSYIDQSPEELRQQAVDEKKKWRTLKAEGKSEEALKAFKRGKELERQAANLEISLRKNRKRVLSSSSMADDEKDSDDSKTSRRKSKLTSQRSKDKDDVADELRQLGWSDGDLHDADRKPVVMTVEGEFSTILGEVSQKSLSNKKTHSLDKSQIIAHKKKALELKRAGNIAEAKDELKKAKILEKQIEEQELLGDSEDSDEELSSLMRSLDVDKHDKLSKGYNLDFNTDFDIMDTGSGFGLDDHFDITDEDMNDPEIAAALNSLGWTEGTDDSEVSEGHIMPSDTEALVSKIQSLKREAVNQKRAGNTVEAIELLKKAKILEKDLEAADSPQEDLISHSSATVRKGSTSTLVEESYNIDIKVARTADKIEGTEPKIKQKSKLMIQRELLGLKKKALALRREGRLDEAEEELRKGKVLEQQLEEIDNPPRALEPSAKNEQYDMTETADVGDVVTDQDLQDPAYLSLLRNLGWEDEQNENLTSRSSVDHQNASVPINDLSVTQATKIRQVTASIRSKGEIQRELLGLKRKSLALRREGQVKEAEEVLETARSLEAQLAEIESSKSKEVPTETKEQNEGMIVDSLQDNSDFPSQPASVESPIKDFEGKGKIMPKNVDDIVHANEKVLIESNPKTADHSQNEASSLHQQILARKRKALALKREGKLAEAKEELRQAKLLEVVPEEKSQPTASSGDTSAPIEKEISPDVPLVKRKDSSPNSGSKPLSGRDRFKLQQESLSHKRQSLRLRREGRISEADAEFELAKALESQLEELNARDSTKSSDVSTADDVRVEDLLDPQLLSALKAIGLEDGNALSGEVSSPQDLQMIDQKKSVAVKVDTSTEEREHLEEQIKAEKLKAINLKRSGKQAEALDALRIAKVFEKKLNSLNLS